MEIYEYSLKEKDMVIVYEIPAPAHEPNTFAFNPRPCDVVEAAIKLDIIKEAWDYDNGLNGQQLRYGLQGAGDKPIYYTYAQLEIEFGGDDLHAIALHLSEIEETRRQKELEAELLNQLI